MLDLVNAVWRFTDNETEVIAPVTSLVNSGKVQLCGTFNGRKFDLPKPPTASRK